VKFIYFMTNPTITQSQKRFNDSLGSLFTKDPGKQAEILFIKSSSDEGVIRNGGRNGARYAPQSLLSYFKKLNRSNELNKKAFLEMEVSSELEEKNDFASAQENEAKRIAQFIAGRKFEFLCHIGGGHDHVYPCLKALAADYKKLIVLNIDAHADTRTDINSHSGTPFRQLASGFSGDFQLYQIGLLEYANSLSTIEPLERGSAHYLWRRELSSAKTLERFFQSISKEIDNETLVFFSLDADALSGELVPGVSAVNGNGISLEQLSNIWSFYKSLPLSHPPMMGIYELNPVYDTNSMLSMRVIGSFLYECLMK
jgi:formiminoglutamase